MPAGLAWIEAAKLGSLDGANAVSRVAAPHISDQSEVLRQLTGPIAVLGREVLITGSAPG
ncbi:hypothetical protein A6A25_32600 [Saccharothrix sp. CB00851]|nr:hypothetical protein A6A25_32600 [Saccharothrix sp. CB00851]